MECRTYRYYGHTVFDNPLSYRTQEEQDYWRGRDPLKLFREKVVPGGLISTEELDYLDLEAEELMEEAIRFADESPLPLPGEIYEDVYVDYPIDMMHRGINLEV